MVFQEKSTGLTLAELAERCTHESDRFFARKSYDPQFCYELFRLGIVENDQMAWRLLFDQYRPLVASWVQRQPAFPISGEEAAFFVNGAFSRLAKAISAADFSRFPSLRAILGYLQMCVVSEVNDHMRSRRGADTLPLEQIPLAAHMAPDDVERTAEEGSERKALWHLIRSCANDDNEFLVVYASYVLGLKPRQLFERYPERFGSVQRIYRIKENILARLRRDPRISSFLE